MNRLYVFVAGAGAVVALAAGCSSSTKNAVTTPPTTSGAAAVVKTASSPLGQILTDGNGRTLYLFTADTGTTSTCTGSCAAIWPADTTTGTPSAGGGMSGAMLGTSTRSDDHKTQVTFDGHPLYYYSHDSKAGDVNGQGTQGTWFVVSPSGQAITASHMPTSPSGPSSPSPSGSGGSGGGYGY